MNSQRWMVVGCLGAVGILVLLVVILWANSVGRYDKLVRLQEEVNGGVSMFASAVNTCGEKMKSVWAMAQQEGLLEKEAYQGIAHARSGLEKARAEFDEAKDKQVSPFDIQKLGAAFGQSLVNVRVAFEAYPQLRVSEVYQRAMAVVEEGFNEIKTSLDDWIALCQGYNIYRRSFMTNLVVGLFFSGKFPEKVDYYEGGIERPTQFRLKAEDLAPTAR